MKKIIFPFAFLLVSVLTFAQVPQSFSYQAVVRDRNNNVVADQYIQVSICILQDSWEVYTETHNPKTNTNGLFTIEIGSGNSFGNFSAIDWSKGKYFIKTETEYGTTTTQLLSVPFAMYAAKAGNVNVDLSNYATVNQLPTNVSDLNNDAGFITRNDIPTIPEMSTVPTKVSDLKNDAGFVTANDVPTKVSELTNDMGYVTKKDIPEVPIVPTNISSFKNDAGYITKADIPTANTKLSQFTNDKGFVTSDDVPTKMSELENDIDLVSKSYLTSIIDKLNKRIAALESNSNGGGTQNEDNNNDENQGENNENNDSNVEYVDLGLPSGNLWATCNLGASKPEEYGDYYAWGEIEPKFHYNEFNEIVWNDSNKKGYSQDNYKYYGYNAEYGLYEYTKYCTETYIGNKDDLTELEPSDDAATVNLGYDWAIPTMEDWIELNSYCYATYTYDYKNSKKYGWIFYKYKRNDDGSKNTDGRQYTYKDDHIFIPSSGSYSGRRFYQYLHVPNKYSGGEYGVYWTNSINEKTKGSEANAYIFYSGSWGSCLSSLTSDSGYFCTAQKYTSGTYIAARGTRGHEGFPIRPVKHKK